MEGFFVSEIFFLLLLRNLKVCSSAKGKTTIGMHPYNINSFMNAFNFLSILKISVVIEYTFVFFNGKPKLPQNHRTL